MRNHPLKSFTVFNYHLVYFSFSYKDFDKIARCQTLLGISIRFDSIFPLSIFFRENSERNRKSKMRVWNRSTSANRKILSILTIIFLLFFQLRAWIRRSLPRTWHRTCSGLWGKKELRLRSVLLRFHLTVVPLNRAHRSLARVPPSYERRMEHPVITS